MVNKSLFGTPLIYNVMCNDGYDLEIYQSNGTLPFLMSKSCTNGPFSMAK